MLNRDIYQKDPSTRKLVNEGVASVNDEKTNQALSVLHGIATERASMPTTER